MSEKKIEIFIARNKDGSLLQTLVKPWFDGEDWHGTSFDAYLPKDYFPKVAPCELFEAEIVLGEKL